MNDVSLLIKPASSLCNLRCRYCFYEDESENRLQKCMGLMRQETAERLIDAAFAAQRGSGSITFSFQGGEPTVAGLEFFERFVALVEGKKRRSVRVHYALQTNGMVLDAAWAAFLNKNRFLVGLSVDGDRETHEACRVDAQGKGTYAKAVTALHLLQKAQVEVNLLCVVTRQCARSPQKVYNALKKLGARYLQFIPCLDPLQAQRGSLDYSLTPQDYGRFLCTLFDCWFYDWQHGQYTSIRQFDDYVHLAMGIASASCACAGRCGGYLVIEADGSAYPCDFYAMDDWRLGNIHDASLDTLMAGERYCAFVRESLKRPAVCTDCPHAALCRSGCRRDWLARERENYFCAAYRQFFDYAGPRLTWLAARERMARCAR